MDLTVFLANTNTISHLEITPIKVDPWPLFSGVGYGFPLKSLFDA